MGVGFVIGHHIPDDLPGSLDAAGHSNPQFAPSPLGRLLACSLVKQGKADRLAHGQGSHNHRDLDQDRLAKRGKEKGAEDQYRSRQDDPGDIGDHHRLYQRRRDDGTAGGEADGSGKRQQADPRYAHNQRSAEGVAAP